MARNAASSKKFSPYIEYFAVGGGLNNNGEPATATKRLHDAPMDEALIWRSNFASFSDIFAHGCVMPIRAALANIKCRRSGYTIRASVLR